MRLFVYLWLSVVSFSAFSEEVDCDNAITTIEVNYCAGQEVAKAEELLTKYFTAALEAIKEQKGAYEGLQKSQVAWQNYREEYCYAIYENWIEGSIRGYMHSMCKLKLTQQRTYNIWGDYLTYMDSTPPRLPEPKK